MKVVFYEKPGCVNNTRQKALLCQAGHEVEARSLLDFPFEAAGLRRFFGQLPVAAWFNPSAPRVKSGEIRPDGFDETGAIAAMLADRLLIRRPLLDSGDWQGVGFDDAIQKRLGVISSEGLEQCPRTTPSQCP